MSVSATHKIPPRFSSQNRLHFSSSRVLIIKLSNKTSLFLTTNTEQTRSPPFEDSNYQAFEIQEQTRLS